MMNFRKLVAASAAMALVAVGHNVIAQDDLDDLLAALESDSSGGASAEAATPAEPAETPEVAARDEEPAPAAEAEEPAAAEADEPEPSEEPADEPEEEPAAEEPAAEAEEEPAAEEPADEPEEPAPAEEGPAVAAVPAAPAAAEAEPEAGSEAEEPAVEVAAELSGDDAELLANVAAAQRLGRQAYDLQAKREIQIARSCMRSEEYLEAAKHYRLAQKYLNDSPATATLRRECGQGIAEGLYRAALQEDGIGRRDRAIKLMKKAMEFRHPKARRQLEQWKDGVDPSSLQADVSEVRGRISEPEYAAKRAEILKHLRRSRQLLGTKELDAALDECEIVLVLDPTNQEAIRLRGKIERKMYTIGEQEREAAREGMIADVNRAWRPAYAVNARDSVKKTGGTVKTETADDTERTQEQNVIARMKAMKLPQVTFKPPATISDAVDFFQTASIDYDDPRLPREERGFGFIIRNNDNAPVPMSAASSEVEEGFGVGGDEDMPMPTGPGVFTTMLSLPNPTFYEALTEVCSQVGYKFKVKGRNIYIMPKNMTAEEMTTRSYPVLSTFMERMNTASAELKEANPGRGFGGGGRRNDDNTGEGNEEEDLKDYFRMMGLEFPTGSRIMYLPSLGKLRVRNTYENLAEFEKALVELNADPRLIEIEARFVEVCQEDLNSLGFEWILNSDYTLNLPKHLARALNVKNGAWGKSDSTVTYTDGTSYSTVGGGISTAGGTTVKNTASEMTSSSSRTFYANSNGASWIKDKGSQVNSHRNAGINGFGGDSEYGTGQRYLSTLSNHISGESKSTNDQFMRVNAFLGGADLSMILHMLSQRSDTDLLSAPKVLTKTGQPATMKVVTEFIYPESYNVQLQSSSSSSSSYGGSQSAILAVVEPESFKMREVGVILETTPTLTDDGNIIDIVIDARVVDEPTWKNYGMKIPFTGNSSSLQNFQGIGDILGGLSDVLATIGTGLTDAVKQTFAESTVNAATSALDSLTTKSNETMTYYDAPMEQPFFHVRQIQSNLSLAPGATIVMGGLITEARKAMDDKIPFLGDLPFIGRLFRSHSEQTKKRNLLIFLTARLVTISGKEVVVDSTGELKAENPVIPSPSVGD